ncbi:acyltransferase family protein [Paenibacillus favisporus]|uniref:acyltransferase family protein n=1 Tax=Paenibacillus TaxID=44249 RepID=UPI0011AB5E5B|nr:MULTISPECIES: acyltransferase family protein [Paenibacillus]MEC0175090.1 acyltransferase family protein [Paenibacillus favisporus]
MRKDYIDWLRNIGILYLFPYHTARIFDNISPFYIKHKAYTMASLLVHSSFWFMPLLFLLAGMSSLYALRRRTASIFVKERFLRLLVPFIIGVLVIVPPQGYYARRFHLNEQESYGTFLIRYFTDLSDWSEYAGGISPAHLWFILFLFLISLGLLPLMRLLMNKEYSPKWMNHPIGVLWPFIGLALLSTLPDISGKNIFLYAGYFILGFLLATRDAIIDTISHYRTYYLAAALCGSVALLVEIYTVGMQTNFICTLLHSLIYWIALLAILGFGRKHLNKKSKMMDYFTPAAFPVYIVHQTYLVMIGYYILKGAPNDFIAYLLILVLSLAASVATYELVRRIKPIRFLFGLKA